MAHLQVAPYPSGGGAHPSRRKGQAKGCVRARNIGRLTLALSGAPNVLLGSEPIIALINSSRHEYHHPPLERVVRRHPRSPPGATAFMVPKATNIKARPSNAMPPTPHLLFLATLHAT